MARLCGVCHGSGWVGPRTLREKRPQGSTADINSGHTSQYYDDNYRISWDDPNQQKRHWTDQDRPKGSADRHREPDDAK